MSARLAPYVLTLLVAFYAGALPAADAAYDWASLSGEQQYILSGFAARWAKLDLAARRALVARADARSGAARPATKAGGGTSDTAKADAKASDKAATSHKPSRRRRSLSVSEAGLSAHSLRLRRALRELPGLSVSERRAVLERWSGLSGPQRLLLVDRYMHNVDDEDELGLQAALRDGTISNADLQRGLASGKLEASDVKNAIASGSLSTTTLKDGVASKTLDAEALGKVMRDANIESSELSNAIEHNLPPPSAGGSATPTAPGSPAR